MSDSQLDDAAFEIYSVDPTEFVAARKAAADSAKKSGDRRLAAAIGKLRKPTTVGWMVNLLVRAEPEDIAELFDLGDSLRSAQRRSDAEELRSLSARRQQSIRLLSRRAAELAAAHGRSSTEDAVREVGQTLGAALADPEIAERVRAGRVVTAESYSGFGPAILALAPEPDESDDHEDENLEVAAEESDSNSEDARNNEALIEELANLEEAREDEDAARIAAEDAQSDAESAVTQLAEIKDRLTRLRAELHELETQEADARKAEKSTDRESRRLARVLDDARTRTAELERTVDELGG
ncbi:MULTISPECIES: hypothetical protein [Nocardiaceae]|uniref:hypothetical protein n=1 Tax=Nocardiaceae TaxID=85025 RepID=UPI001E619961|nr:MULTISPECIES: hypothetical protein [Rhodococcus]MCC8929841.1 hypothetical protein [Rhodococcus sp. I2R]MCZ4277174.1 hypothetical protein [Rhodococcus yunnanensis]